MVALVAPNIGLACPTPYTLPDRVCFQYADRFECELVQLPAGEVFYAWKDPVFNHLCVEIHDGSGSAIRNETLDLTLISTGSTFQVGDIDAKALIVQGTDGADEIRLHHPSAANQVAPGTSPLVAQVNGSYGADVIHGSDHFGPGYEDRLFGGAGADTIHGYDGDDELLGQGGADTLHGGFGDDTIDGGDGDDDIHGDHGDDTLRGFDGQNHIHGGQGADRIIGGQGVDRIWGGPGADTITDLFGDDVMFGEGGDDDIDGGPGDDRIAGGAGEDTLRGGFHDDILCGEDNYSSITNNKLFGDEGVDCLDPGPGNTSSTFTWVLDCGPTADDWYADRGRGPAVDCEWSDVVAPGATWSFCDTATW